MTMKKLLCTILVFAMIASLTACGLSKSTNTKKDPLDFDSDDKTASPKVTEAPTPSPSPIPEPTFCGGFKDEELNADAKNVPAVCILDAETGDVLYSTENFRERKYIASVTKLLTALTALDWIKESELDEKVTIEGRWLKLLKTDSSIDAYGLKEGAKYTLGDLFALMLVKSYGDAAESIRYICEGRSGRDFFELMNEKAQEIGMTASHFDNTIGLDIGNNFTENYSTAYDAALLIKAAMKSEIIRYYASGKKIKLTDGNTLDSTNSILHNGPKIDNLSVVCGKTGGTKAAQLTLAVGFKDELTGKEYAAVYLHSKDWGNLNNELIYTMKFVLQEAGEKN